MNFIEIAFKNVKKKIGNYLIYFICTIFSVVIFNLFSSMYYNPAFETYRFGEGKMTTLLRGTAVAVLLFASVFVLYSSSYFIKTQKKEIAIYSLLGMRKNQIAMMMFFETFFVGILAVLCGTAISTFSADYFTSLLMKFMAVGTNVKFAVAPQAILATIGAFLILFIVCGLAAYRTIYRYRLITLLSAEKQSEGLPKYSHVGVFGAIFMVILSYGIAMVMDVNQSGFRLLLPAFIIILLITAGTYLLFQNVVPMVAAWLKKRTSLYYKTSNLVGLSQIAFRLQANSKMLAVAALLITTTITMLSATYSLYRGLEDSVRFYAPYSYLVKDITEEQYQEIQTIVTKVGEVRIASDDQIELLKTQIQGMDGYVMSESMYLKVLADTHTKYGTLANIKSDFTGGLRDGECYYISGDVQAEACEGLIGQSISISEEQFQIVGTGLHKYIGMMDLYQHSTLVISDDCYGKYRLELEEEQVDQFTGFVFDDDKKAKNTVAAIDQIIPARFDYGGFPGNASYYEVYKANFALYGPYVFIGLFIGILFVAAVGSVLYYKMIIEAQEERPRYRILRKIGMKKGEIRASVFKQLGMVYGIPLLIGLMHTVFALLTYNRMMDLIGQETPTLQNAIIVSILFLGAYGFFYLLSVRSYCKIILKEL